MKSLEICPIEYFSFLKANVVACVHSMSERRHVIEFMNMNIGVIRTKLFVTFYVRLDFLMKEQYLQRNSKLL